MLRRSRVARAMALLFYLGLITLVTVPVLAARNGCVCFDTVPAFAGPGTSWNTSAKDGGQILCRLDPKSGNVQFWNGRDWQNAECPGGFPWLLLLILLIAVVVGIAALSGG